MASGATLDGMASHVFRPPHRPPRTRTPPPAPAAARLPTPARTRPLALVPARPLALAAARLLALARPRLLTPARARLLALVTAGGAVLATVLTVLAHVASAPGMDAVSLTISDYAVSDRGTPMVAAMFVLGAASLALPLGLRAAGSGVGRLPATLLLGWSGGLIAAAAIPTDPLGTAPLSTQGYVHRYVSVTAFVCLPVAVLLAVRRLGADPRWQGGLRPVRALAVTSVVGLAGLYLVAYPGDRVMMGLVQRILVATEVLLLALLAVRLYRVAGSPVPRRGADLSR